MKKRPKVAIVLSGGGALGFAHVGVIDILQKNKVPIDMIVGTSMGAIIGGAIACGKTCDELESIAEKMRTKDLYDFNLTFKGLLSGKGAMKFLKRELPNIDIKDTKIPFICNAVDLVSSQEVIFKEGNLIDCIRASISIPGVFNPVQMGDMLLVDGGIINNMPHDIARKEGADIIIAVDVVSKSILPNKVNNIIHTIMISSLISQKEMQKCKRKYYNVLIQPNLGEFRQHDFSGKTCKEIIELGRVAALEKLDKIKELINDF